jgi:hypothetical protein
LELLVLLRAFQKGILGTYGYFYSYATSVLIGSIVLSVARTLAPSLYPECYWTIQLVTLIFGCGVILEVLKHVLSPYPGAERFARFVGLAIFAAIFCFALVYPLIVPGSYHPDIGVELERNLRMVQAILLFCILAVIFYYRIPIGINMKGMTLGYGLYVATSLVTLAVRAYAGAWLMTIWVYAQAVSFVISLFIWLIALWSYAPNLSPGSDIRLEADYEALVARTRITMDAMRSYLTKTVRQ